MAELQVFTEEQWEARVLRCPHPVLVDFRAPWCRSQALQDSLLDWIAEDFGGRLKVGFVDIVQSLDLAFACRVQELPSLVLLRDGKRLASYGGPHRVEKMLERHLRFQIHPPVAPAV